MKFRKNIKRKVLLSHECFANRRIAYYCRAMAASLGNWSNTACDYATYTQALSDSGVSADEVRIRFIPEEIPNYDVDIELANVRHIPNTSNAVKQLQAGIFGGFKRGELAIIASSIKSPMKKDEIEHNTTSLNLAGLSAEDVELVTLYPNLLK